MPELLCGGILDGIFRHLVYCGKRKRYKILGYKIETLSSSFRFYRC